MRHGFACLDITVTVIGSFELETVSGVYSELQCGSYIFVDADSSRKLDRDGAPTKGVRAEPLCLGDGNEPPGRRPRHRRRRAQGARLRLGASPACNEPAATDERASDENGRLGISGATNRPGIGDKIIRLVPGHCDPTVNRVEQLWPITARGALY